MKFLGDTIPIKGSPGPDMPEPKSVPHFREITNYKLQITNNGWDSGIGDSHGKRPAGGKSGGGFRMNLTAVCSRFLLYIIV